MYYVFWAAIIIIFIWRIIVGFRKGMVQEIISLIAMGIAGLCVMLILGVVESYLDREMGQVIRLVAVLFVVCLVYRLIHILFTSLQLISKLPIIKGADKLLGAVIGFLEAGLIVSFLVYFIKNWGLSILI